VPEDPPLVVVELRAVPVLVRGRELDAPAREAADLERVLKLLEGAVGGVGALVAGRRLVAPGDDEHVEQAERLGETAHEVDPEGDVPARWGDDQAVGAGRLLQVPAAGIAVPGRLAGGGEGPELERGARGRHRGTIPRPGRRTV
jgi:hypothetical protein